MPKFLTKRKFLTEYALACGYMEVSENYGNSQVINIRLERDSACYHIQGWQPGNHRLFWHSFEHGELEKARSYFMNKLKEYGLKRKIPTPPN